MKMPRRARLKSKSGIYHIMWRGANRQEIFHDDDDCIQFIEIMKRYKLKMNTTIYAWCLMNNHVHLLMKEGSENLSDTMKRIGVSYAGYYNWKYRTNGHLFQGRFRSETVESARYFQIVIRYIHQNPVKAGIVHHVDEWKWSSCQEYYGKSKNSWGFVHCKPIFSMFSPDLTTAKQLFKEFNETTNHDDQCLEDVEPKRRLTDEEARKEIKELLGEIEIAQVKSLPKQQRDPLLRHIKEMRRIPQRQMARILGVSVNLVFKA
jgi:putative transposase